MSIRLKYINSVSVFFRARNFYEPALSYDFIWIYFLYMFYSVVIFAFRRAIVQILFEFLRPRTIFELLATTLLLSNQFRNPVCLSCSSSYNTPSYLFISSAIQLYFHFSDSLINFFGLRMNTVIYSLMFGFSFFSYYITALCLLLNCRPFHFGDYYLLW